MSNANTKQFDALLVKMQKAEKPTKTTKRSRRFGTQVRSR